MRHSSYSAAAGAAAIIVSSGLVSTAYGDYGEGMSSLTNLDEEFRYSVLGGETFRIEQVPNEQFSGVYNGPLAMAKAYTKFGVALPDDLAASVDSILAANVTDDSATLNATRIGGGGRNSGTGEVTARPEQFDIEYLSPVRIGSPPQTLMLDFDTGSSDLWVFSSETPTAQVKGQTRYDIGRSSTSRVVNGATWSIRYGDGSSSSGAVYTDTVTIGGVTVQNQAVESARTVSATFTANPNSDGLLGLAFSTINTVRPQAQRTFFDNAMSRLASPVFTANLKKGKAGNYNFGFIDRTEFTGTMTFVPVNPARGFWEFTSAGYRVGAATTVAAAHTAIMDTGTTLLLLPDAIVNAYYATVPGAQRSTQQGGWVFPCKTRLPSYTAIIGNYQAVVPGDYIKYAPVDGTNINRATTCFGGIQSSAAIGFAIYGDIFMKSQFVVFSGGNNQLGLAPKRL